MALRKLSLLEQNYMMNRENCVAIERFLIPLYGRYHYLIKGVASTYATETLDEAHSVAQKLVAVEERNGLHAQS